MVSRVFNSASQINNMDFHWQFSIRINWNSSFRLVRFILFFCCSVTRFKCLLLYITIKMHWCIQFFFFFCLWLQFKNETDFSSKVTKSKTVSKEILWIARNIFRSKKFVRRAIATTGNKFRFSMNIFDLFTNGKFTRIVLSSMPILANKFYILMNLITLYLLNSIASIEIVDIHSNSIQSAFFFMNVVHNAPNHYASVVCLPFTFHMNSLT